MKVCFSNPSVGSLVAEVGSESLVVGRSKGGAQIQLEGDNTLSRRHGRLWADAQGVWYEDLGSSNGSFSQGARLKAPVRLGPQTEVVLGQTRLTLVTGPPLPGGMELRVEGRAGGEGLTSALLGRGVQAATDPTAVYITAIYDIVQGLLASDGLEFIPLALRRLRQVVPAAQRLALVAWPPHSDGSFQDIIPVQGEGDAPISASLARLAVEQGRALLFSDSELPDRVEAASVLHKGIRSAVYVPLQTAPNEPVIGLLCVDSTTTSLPLTFQHFQFICAVAGLLATTLGAEQLRQEARRQQLAAQRIEARREGLLSFLRIASHDLKNPLTVIASGARLLPRVNEDQRGRLEAMILQASGRAHDLIKAYLDVSEAETGQVLSVEWSTVEARILVEQEIEFLKAALEERIAGVALLNHVPPGTVRADERKLRQIVANLVSNAIKYSPSGGEVAIEGRFSPSEAQFAVRDQGVGISVEDQKRLFGAFTRVGDRSLAPGTGLGLWLTAALVEAHGGRMSVTSTPGQGSTFSFTIPQPEGQEGTGSE